MTGNVHTLTVTWLFIQAAKRWCDAGGSAPDSLTLVCNAHVAGLTVMASQSPDPTSCQLPWR